MLQYKHKLKKKKNLKDDFYNAWDEDIAVVNIFFGKDTVMGELHILS